MKNLSIVVMALLSFLQESQGLLSSIIGLKRKNAFLQMGGYDATIGVDPSTSLQFFTNTGNTCPYAARIYIVLKELMISVDTTEIPIHEKPDWYLNINPRGKVPAIRLPGQDDLLVDDSMICCEFLCDYATTRLNLPTTLMPEDAIQRARIRLMNEHFDNVVLKAQSTFFTNEDVVKDEELIRVMENSLLFYEESLEERGGPYLTGKDFTLSDVHMLPFMLRLSVLLRHCKKYELSLDKFPKLLLWFDSCSQRDSVKGISLTDEEIITGGGNFFKEPSFGG